MSRIKLSLLVTGGIAFTAFDFASLTPGEVIENAKRRKLVKVHSILAEKEVDKHPPTYAILRDVMTMRSPVDEDDGQENKWNSGVGTARDNGNDDKVKSKSDSSG